jgi:CHASE1-domain containing sensor protein
MNTSGILIPMPIFAGVDKSAAGVFVGVIVGLVDVANTLDRLFVGEAVIVVEVVVGGIVKGDPSNDSIFQSVLAHNTGTPSTAMVVWLSITQSV